MNDYDRWEDLEAGNFASVFSVTNRVTQKQYAMKSVKWFNPNHRKSAITESEFLKQNISNNIIRWVDVYDYEDTIWMVLGKMDFSLNTIC